MLLTTDTYNQPAFLEKRMISVTSKRMQLQENVQRSNTEGKPLDNLLKSEYSFFLLLILFIFLSEKYFYEKRSSDRW